MNRSCHFDIWYGCFDSCELVDSVEGVGRLDGLQKLFGGHELHLHDSWVYLHSTMNIYIKSQWLNDWH